MTLSDLIDDTIEYLSCENLCATLGTTVETDEESEALEIESTQHTEELIKRLEAMKD